MLPLSASYRSVIDDTFSHVVRDEAEAVQHAAQVLSRAVGAGGVVHVFGAGHSQLVAADATYRAGGPAWTNGILDPALSIMRGALASTLTEKIAANADAIFRQVSPQPQDACVAVCNSGTTPISVRWAELCQQGDVPVVTIVSRSSLNFFKQQEDPRPTIDVFSDLLIDNHCPVGDAAVASERDGQVVSVGPSSTIINLFIAHWLFMNVHDELMKLGKEVEAFRSGHMEGANEFNTRLMVSYKNRISIF